MLDVGVFYTSKQGTTKKRSVELADMIGAKVCEPITSPDSLALFSTCLYPVCGTPTYGMGEMHINWTMFLSQFDNREFEGRNAAVFCLGDQKKHSATFGGGLGQLSNRLLQLGFETVGDTAMTAYELDHSPSLDATGRLPGLLLDDRNQSDLSVDRMQTWAMSILEMTASR